jgi:5-methylcytosine-specific restriction endonuclease McrA
MNPTNLEALESVEVMVLSTGYEPLFRTTWQRAMSDVMSGRAETVEIHETLTVGTAGGKLDLPTKIRMLSGVVKARIRKCRYELNRPGKRVLWQRDGGRCQYCSVKVTLSEATVDHVIPRARGGQHNWMNLVIACSPCNQRKGCRTPSECGMQLLSEPCRPREYISMVT